MLFGVFEDVDPDGRAGRGHRRPGQPRPAADGQRADPAADPVPRRRRALAAAEKAAGEPLEAEEAEKLGLVTFAPDDIDWEEEVRIAVEERAVVLPGRADRAGGELPVRRARRRSRRRSSGG